MINFNLEEELQKIESSENQQLDTPTQAPDDTCEKTSSTDSSEKFERRNIKLLTRISVGIIILALTTFIGWQAYQQKQDEKLENSRQEALSVATEGAVAVLSYSAATIDEDLAKAKTLLTGDFLDYYSRFGVEYVAPAAKQRQISSAVTVTGSSLVSVEKNHAIALIYIAQTTSSQDSPNPNTMSSSLRIELEHEGDNWLISKFEPI